MARIVISVTMLKLKKFGGLSGQAGWQTPLMAARDTVNSGEAEL